MESLKSFLRVKAVAEVRGVLERTRQDWSPAGKLEAFRARQESAVQSRRPVASRV